MTEIYNEDYVYAELGLQSHVFAVSWQFGQQSLAPNLRTAPIGASTSELRGALALYAQRYHMGEGV